MLTAVQHQNEGTKFLRRFVDGQLASPLLLVGPEGVGKSFSVRQAAREAFCEGTKQEDCNCPSCRDVLKGSHPDLEIIRAGEKDIGIDEVRDLIKKSRVVPCVADLKCFVIDGADRFTVAAANAFLKTLEDPPANSHFFLIAEDRTRVLPTLRSRCGLVRYGYLPEDFILSVVQRYDQDSEDPTKALVYTRMGEGSVGCAVHYWGSGKIGLRDHVLRSLQLGVRRDIPGVFSAVDSLGDLELTMKILGQLIHDLLMARVDPMRAIHLDRIDEIQELGASHPVGVWVSLASKIEQLKYRNRSTRLNLAFHLKTLLVESFV